MDVVQKALPQSMNETLTIVVALKQCLQYKNAYHIGRVCVNIVMKALKQLTSRNLYMAENICINEDWNHVLQEGNANSTKMYRLILKVIQMMNQTMKTHRDFDSWTD
jgi:hypothetical protein